MANPSLLLPEPDDTEIAGYVLGGRAIVATPVTTPTSPATTPNAPAPETEEPDTRKYLKDVHRQMTGAQTTDAVNRQMQRSSQDIELADPERQSLRQRGFTKIALFQDRRVVRLMDNIHRATTLKRLDEVREEATEVMAELPGAADDIRRALVSRQNTIKRFRSVGQTLTVIMTGKLALLLYVSGLPHYDEAPIVLIALFGFMAYCLGPHFYRVQRTYLGFKLNWVRVVGEGWGWIGKGFVFIILVGLSFCALN